MLGNPQVADEDLLRATADDVFSGFADQVLAFDAAATHHAAIVVERAHCGSPISGFDAQTQRSAGPTTQASPPKHRQLRPPGHRPRELLPLRGRDRAAYLRWAVGAFRLVTGGTADATQVHTHLCYSEFGDVVGAIDALDADVTTVEAARSRMEVQKELSAGVRAQRPAARPR